MLHINEPDFSPNDEILGQKNTYRVIKNMGGGAYARPYLVENIENQTKAILKFNRRVDEAEIVRLVRQTFLDRNETPLVVEILDSLQITFKGWYGHIESLAEGQACHENKPNELQSLQIAQEFAHTLKYCAMKEIGYLDVKPLTHIFWLPSTNNTKPTIKVIDWNAGTKNASFSKLRKDITDFCKTLPELFTGQEIQKFKVNPLSWDFDFNTNNQLQVTYATWILLASLSLDWAGPTIPELREVLQLPNSNITTKGVKLIIDAWDAIAEQIRKTIDRINTPGSQDFIPAYSPSPRPKPQKGFDKISEALKFKDKDRPSMLIAEMDSQALQIVQWLREIKDDFTMIRLDGEPAMLAMRLLSPGNQQYGVLLSAFEIWKNAAYISSVEIDSDWQKFIQAIIELDFDQLKIINQSTLTRMKEKINTRSVDYEYASEWINKFDGLEEEISIWIILNTGSEADIMRLSSSHPIVKIKQAEIRKRQSINEVFENQLNRLKEAYNNADFQKINTIFKDIENDLDSFSPEQMKQLDVYGDAGRLFETIHSTANSWEQNELEKFEVFYLHLPDEKKNYLQKYNGIVLEKREILSELTSWYSKVSDNPSFDTMDALNLRKYQLAEETVQYKKLIDALTHWVEKEFEKLSLRVSNGLKENKLVTELVKTSLAQTVTLQELARQINLADLELNLAALKMRLEEEEIRIDKFINQIEAYFSLWKEEQSGSPSKQAKEDLEKMPQRIKDLFQAWPYRETKSNEDIPGSLNSAEIDIIKKLSDHDRLLTEIKQSYDTTQVQGLDFQKTKDSIIGQLTLSAEKKPEKLWTLLFSSLLSFLSFFMILILTLFLWQTSQGVVQVQKDLKTLSDIQSTPMVVVITATAIPAVIGNSSPAPEISQSESTPATPEGVASNQEVPTGTPFLYETEGKTISFKDDFGNKIFRTSEGVPSLNLYLIQENDKSMLVGLLVYVFDKNIKDITLANYEIKDAAYLYSPDDPTKQLLIINRPPLGAIPTSIDPTNEAHVVWVEGWIDK